jgi:hypothetical protein
MGDAARFAQGVFVLHGLEQSDEARVDHITIS